MADVHGDDDVLAKAVACLVCLDPRGERSTTGGSGGRCPRGGDYEVSRAVLRERRVVDRRAEDLYR